MWAGENGPVTSFSEVIIGVPGGFFGCNVVRQIEQLRDALFVFSHVVLTTDNVKGQPMAMASVDVAVAADEFRGAYQILPNDSRR